MLDTPKELTITIKSEVIGAIIAYFCIGIGIAGTFSVQNVWTSPIIDIIFLSLYLYYNYSIIFIE